jgi:hypothetical protein
LSAALLRHKKFSRKKLRRCRRRKIITPEHNMPTKTKKKAAAKKPAKKAVKKTAKKK